MLLSLTYTELLFSGAGWDAILVFSHIRVDFGFSAGGGRFGLGMKWAALSPRGSFMPLGSRDLSLTGCGF